MKNFNKIFFAAVAAAFGLASCSQELTPVEKPQGNLVTVNFGAEATIESATKATLTTTDELTFKSAWENGDVLSVEYISPETADNKIITATWNGTSFEAKGLPNETGAWDYTACYPKPDEDDNHIDFGANRTQKGNAYNSIYDVMIGNKSTKNSAAGKDDDGSDIVFNMKRQTAVAYFHLTGGPAEEQLVSATLSVEGGFIASQHAYISNFAFAPSQDLNEITITFDEGTAPKASDFQLWFNVLPTKYTKMTLAVETTGHTMTISRTAADMYEAGKLYKVVKAIPAEKWVKKGGDTPEGSSYTIEFNSKTKTESSLAETTKATTLIIHGSEYVIAQPFSSVSKCYYGGNETNGLPLRIGTSSAAGSITIALSELGQYNATKIILSAKQYSKGKNKSIGVNGSTKQQPGDDYTELSFNLYNSDIESIKLDSDGYIYVKSITVIGTPLPPKYNVNVSKNIDGGEIVSTWGKCAEGSEVVLTPKAQNGYEFGEWSVVAADGTSIDVVDNKFTMPAQDVTVSCTFVKISYTITKAPAENGSFTVKLGDTEVNTAQFRDKLTLTATPNEGYSLEKWTVTYMVDGETEKSFNPSGTFTMPAANVTVSASFVEAASIPVYASVAELIAAGKPTTTATKVTVTLTDEEITDLHKVSGGRYTNGVFFMVGTQEVEVYCWNTPADWEVGGTISGTLTNCDWKLFVDKNTQKETWELCPADYSELTYEAPLTSCATPVITIAEDGVVSIACETAGATIHYTVGDSPADPTEADAVFSAVTLTDGQTIKAIAVAEGFKPSAVASKKYTVGGTTSYFVKVTTAPTDWSGTYLIVYETGNVAFDGSLTTLDAVSNTVDVTISDNKIEATDALMKSVFVIDGKAGSLKSSSGYYVGYTGTKNGMNTNQKTVYKNVFEFDAKTKVITIKSKNSYLKYNSASDQTRFRYFASGQQDIQLYKLDN
ncbi:MAG: FN3 associated domain-containing protein [Bacteroidales bacterium]|nr:FN3 associated domain-containing protein [Bacteroidales bacterium]